MPPSEYFKRNCWVSVEADEVTVPHFVETFGDDMLIFSTDYPHGDSKYPHAVDSFDKLPLSDDGKAKIVSTNWSALYDIPLTKKV